MIVKVDNMPIVDWDANRKLAANQADLGDDMLALLAKSLVIELAAINEFYHDKMFSEMRECVHKLHGAVAYCGTPRLKAVLAVLEDRLHKKDFAALPELILQLNDEAALVVSHRKKNC